MPGRNPYQAVEAFIDPIQAAIACLASAKISVSHGGRHEVAVTHSWAINAGRGITLEGRATTGLRVPLTFRATMSYEIVRGERDEWRVSTRGYHYVIGAASDEVVGYHWHPDGQSHVATPHVHIGAAALTEDGVLTPKSHLPTERVSFESMIRLLITEFGVEPAAADWHQRLDVSEGVFQLYRSWSERQHMPPHA